GRSMMARDPMKRRLVLIALGSLAAALTLASSAPANGGSSIANAPELPTGTAVSGGGSEFWKVTLAGGDRLTIDYQPVNGGCVHLYVYSPGVTDSTLDSTNSVTSDGSCVKHEFGWTAIGQGRWILRV